MGTIFFHISETNRMFKNPLISTSLVTAYLLIYITLFFTGASFNVLGTMFILSPFLVIWMALSILRDRKYKVRELDADEEWGYADKPSSELS